MLEEERSKRQNSSKLRADSGVIRVKYPQYRIPDHPPSILTAFDYDATLEAYPLSQQPLACIALLELVYRFDVSACSLFPPLSSLSACCSCSLLIYFSLDLVIFSFYTPVYHRPAYFLSTPCPTSYRALSTFRVIK